MTAQSDFEIRIKHDAETLVSRMGDVETILQPLTPASTLDESTSSAVMERLDDLDCLRFTAWCTDQDPDWLSEFLHKVNVESDSVDRILKFAARYSTYGLFLRRLNRTNQGYENEITRLSGRPSVQTLGNNILVTVRLYNHDRLLLTSSNDLDGLVELISMLLETANDAAESISTLAPEVLKSSIDPDDVAEVLQKANTLSKFTAVPTPVTTRAEE